MFVYAPVSFCLYTVSTFLVTILPYVSAYYFGKIGGGVVQSGATYELVFYFVLAWSLLVLAESIAGTITSIIDTWFDMKVYKQIEANYVYRLNNLDIGKTESEEYISTYQKLTSGDYPPYKLFSFVRKLLKFVFADIFALGISLAIISQINIVYTGLLILLLIPRFIARLVYGDKVFEIWSNPDDAKDRLIMYDNYNYLRQRSIKPEVILHNYHSIFLTRMNQAIDRMFNRKKKLMSQKIAVELLADILYQVGIFILIVSLVKQTLAGVYTFSFFTLVFYSLNQIAGTVINLLDAISAFVNDNKMLNEMRKMYTMKPLLETIARKEVTIPDDVLVSFKDVCFSYAGLSTLQNKNITLDIKKGERLAVIGLNGAGKTTFIKLLTRIYDPVSGEIIVSVNDRPETLRAVTPADWQKNISCMFQDYGKYELTIKDFISLGEEYSEEKVKKAIDMAAADFVYELKDGLDQQLGIDLGGIDLSKGQWQKLTLARTLYAEKALLILDEPTATIDAISSRRIYENLKRLPSDKTLIFISHNMVDIPLVATRIMMIEHGQIVGIGTHEELLKQSTQYQELYASARE